MDLIFLLLHQSKARLHRRVFAKLLATLSCRLIIISLSQLLTNGFQRSVNSRTCRNSSTNRSCEKILFEIHQVAGLTLKAGESSSGNIKSMVYFIYIRIGALPAGGNHITSTPALLIPHLNRQPNISATTVTRFVQLSAEMPSY